MAKLCQVPAHAPLRGKFGDKIYKWYGDTCVVQKLPTPLRSGRHPRPRRPGLLRVGCPEAAPHIYLLAKADAMKAPTLRTPLMSERYKGRAGEIVVIGTGDMFRVQTLRVTVRDAAGDVVETGVATRYKKDFHYTLKRPHPRDQVLTWEAVAESRAGHSVSAVQQLPPRK